MEKYKFRSTVYGVFLLISILILIIFIALSDSNKKTKNKTISEVNSVLELYNNAYSFISSDLLSKDTYRINYSYCNIFNIYGLKNYFTESLINKLDFDFISTKDNNYDCGDNKSKIINSNIFSKNNELILVSETNKYIVMKNNEGFLITFEKMESHWLIDSFE